LNSKRITIAWTGSIAILAIFAGLSWLNLELSPEAGAQKFEISGFQVFPIISALLLLQVAALLASLLTPIIVSRVISAILSPIMLAHGFFVVAGLQSSLQNAIEAQITEITGVAGFASQAEFVAFAGDTFLWVGYLLAISLNLAILLTKSLSKVAQSEARPTKEALVEEQDLWETQK
jgi:hypothetical protein